MGEELGRFFEGAFKAMITLFFIGIAIVAVLAFSIGYFIR